MNSLIDLISDRFSLKAASCGEFSEMKAGPMKFSVSHWDGGRLGNIALMKGSAMMGLMKMDTLVINPREIDMPLLSVDTILAAGKLTVIAEIYDTTAGGFDQKACLEVKKSLYAFGDRVSGTNWYDDIRLSCSWGKLGRKKDLPAFEKALASYLSAYLDAAAACSRITDKETLAKKNRRTDAYVNGLLENGGPSTDVFMKKFGKENTERFYHEVLFG